MEKVKIQDNIFEIKNIFEHPPLLEIEFSDFVDMSNLDIVLIEVLTSGGMKCREFTEYTTIYRIIEEENKVILSSDGSTYKEPTNIEFPEPYIPTEKELQLVEISLQINKLKTQLEETDYKIIKCSEYQLVGLDIPYDISTLHNERQAIRDQINDLENAILEIK